MPGFSRHQAQGGIAAHGAEQHAQRAGFVFQVHGVLGELAHGLAGYVVVPFKSDPLFHFVSSYQARVWRGVDATWRTGISTVCLPGSPGSQVSREPSGFSFCTSRQALTHCRHWVQLNFARLWLRVGRRMGQASSQALVQSRQAAARLVSKVTTRPLPLVIQAMLCTRPTAQPYLQNRCRANRKSKVKAAVATARKMAGYKPIWPVTRSVYSGMGGNR